MPTSTTTSTARRPATRPGWPRPSRAAAGRPPGPGPAGTREGERRSREPEAAGGDWTDERGTSESSREPKGRGGAWTDERGTSEEEGRRRPKSGPGVSGTTENHGPFGIRILTFGEDAGEARVAAHGGAVAQHRRSGLGRCSGARRGPDRRDGGLPAGGGRRRAEVPARGRERAARVQAAVRRCAGADRRSGPVSHAGVRGGTQLLGGAGRSAAAGQPGQHLPRVLRGSRLPHPHQR